MTLTLELDPDLEALLNDSAHKRGVTPEAIAVQVLREKLSTLQPESLESRDDWERTLRSIATPRGFGLTNEQLGREEIYD